MMRNKSMKEKIKKNLIIIGVIFSIIFTTLYIDDHLRKDSENPHKVGKAFSFAYMIGDKEAMKGWSDESIHQKIEKENINDLSTHWNRFFDWNLFYLDRLERPAREIIIATYTYNDESSSLILPPSLVSLPLHYSVVIESMEDYSSWEKIKLFIYHQRPFFERKFGFHYPTVKDRWLITDFYSESNAEIAKVELSQYKEALEDEDKVKQKVKEYLEKSRNYRQYLKVIRENIVAIMGRQYQEVRSQY